MEPNKKLGKATLLRLQTIWEKKQPKTRVATLAKKSALQAIRWQLHQLSAEE